jgi:hypothetical protein
MLVTYVTSEAHCKLGHESIQLTRDLQGELGYYADSKDL